MQKRVGERLLSMALFKVPFSGSAVEILVTELRIRAALRYNALAWSP